MPFTKKIKKVKKKYKYNNERPKPRKTIKHCWEKLKTEINLENILY